MLRGDIEGLRAIAVLMVLLYHVRVPGFSGGFAGVDVFFVISGYLITGQLVKEARRDGRIRLPRFYARRARRLLPAASLTLLATTVAGWWLLPRSAHAELGTDVLGATGYVVNWVLAAREVDYLAEDSIPSLVQHYWSLSVEEQFYLGWPLLVILSRWVVHRYRLRLVPVLTITLTLVIATSLAWSIYSTATSPGTAYFATTTRVWQLGAGAILVLATPVIARLRAPAATGLAWAGLVLIAATITSITTATPWPGSAALLPTVGTAAVIAVGIARPQSSPAILLGKPPMRFLGAISYGLYLWHWPALGLLAQTHPDAGIITRLGIAAASILLAWATLHLVENPLRYRPALANSTARSLTFALLTMVLTAGAALALHSSAPVLSTRAQDDVLDLDGGPLDPGLATGPGEVVPTGSDVLIDDAGAIGLVVTASRTSDELEMIPDPHRVFTTSGPIYPDPGSATADIPMAAYDEDCQVKKESTALLDEGACWFGDPDGEKVAALVGDSKMLQWLTALDPIAREEGWRLKVYTKSACGLASIEMYPQCHTYNRALSTRLADGEHTPDLIFTSMVRSGGQELGASVAALLQPAADAGASVVVLADNPSPSASELGGPAYRCVEKHPNDYLACSYATGEGSGTPALRVAASRLEAPLIDLRGWICPADGAEPACPPVVGKVLAFRQGSHLTATYVASLTPILHHELVRAGVATTAYEQIPWRIPTPGDEG